MPALIPAVAVLLPPVIGGATAVTLASLAPLLIQAGAGLALYGIGSLLSKGPVASGGIEISSRNPTAPWNVIYGRSRIGGTIIYINSFGGSDKFLDLVMVLACHPCEAVEALYFNNQRVLFGSGNTSVTPLQQSIPIFDISRVGNLVTVVLHSDITQLSDGDQVGIQNITGDRTLNGQFPVHIVGRSGGFLTFTYQCGGLAAHVTGQGECVTTWPDYGKKVYFESMLGGQTQGQTFTGMTTGTLADGIPGSFVLPGVNPWTVNCSAVGKTVVFLRLHYNDVIFANGFPNISFLVKGKNDILDPRTTTVGYTENAALCIADELSNTEWGYRAIYGTEIPDAELIAAANICDEAVPLAISGTEPRYTCNGGFPLSMRKGEVLQNMLTSCAGRLDARGGQFRIFPASWTGVTETISGTSIYSLCTAGFRWSPRVSISETYNGVKGSYISPVDNWGASDFPAYAQDVLHGYSSDANLAEDGGDRRWLDVQLPFTISSSMAQRLAKIELMRRRQQGNGTFALNMAGYQFTPMDVLAVDLPFFGWTGKTLEVRALRFKLDRQSDADSEVTLLGTEIDVQETDSSVFHWDVAEELSPAGYQQSFIPDNRTPAPPTNVVLESDNNEIHVTWTAPADAFVLLGGHVELEYQLVQSPEGLWLSLAKMDPTVTVATIANLTAGDQYTVQIRSVNAAGVPSAWIEGVPQDASPPVAGPITVGGPTAPSAMAAFQVDTSAIDPTVAEVAVVTFVDPTNVRFISAGNFSFYYVDEQASPDFLAPNPDPDIPAATALTTTSTRMQLNSATDISAGEYVLCGREIYLCGTPTGGDIVPITRAQLGSLVDTATGSTSPPTTSSAVLRVMQKTTGVAFGGDFWNGPNAATWILDMPLPEMKLVSVAGYMVNGDIQSDTTFNCVTDNTDHGLRLNAPPPGSTVFRMVNVTNANTVLIPGNQVVTVVATASPATPVIITLPAESASYGIQVTVRRTTGSTNDVIVAEGAGDTIDGSASNITLNATNPTWTGIGR
jgi:hypothetical protein